MSYDPTLHLTAGRLREMGADLPAHIPHCAYVERTACIFSPDSVVAIEGRVVTRFALKFSQPFRWEELDGDVPVNAPDTFMYADPHDCRQEP